MVSKSSKDIKACRPDDSINKRTGVSAVPDGPYLSHHQNHIRQAPNMYMPIPEPHLLYQYTSIYLTHSQSYLTYNLALTFRYSRRRKTLLQRSIRPPTHTHSHHNTQPFPPLHCCKGIAWRADCQIDTLPYMHTGLAPSLFPQLRRGSKKSAFLFRKSELPVPLLNHCYLRTVQFMHVIYAYSNCTVHITNLVLLTGSECT